jgi:multiple sugar transport system substrate-binding protein
MAWYDPEVDRQARGFFSATAATIEAAWVRPRAARWPAFQLTAGRLLATALSDHDGATATLDRLDTLFRKHKGSSR